MTNDAEYGVKLRDSLFSIRSLCWDLYCENNLYMYSEVPLNTWFISKISEEHHFLFTLQLLIDNVEDEDLSIEMQSDLMPILKQANKLIDEMGGVRSKIIFIEQRELNYCIRHAEAINKIVSIITKED